MVPCLVKQFEDDLNVERVSKFSPTDLAIARTPEGTAFIDVLDTKSKQVPNKSAKDYDTLKWEEEVRAEVAKKRGQQGKKLTADEQSKVNAQLAKESEIRQEVKSQEEILRRGAGIIESLAHGPPTDAEAWMNAAAGSLCGLARVGAGAIAGASICSAFIACGDRLSHRLGEIRPFIAIATLRTLGETHLPSELAAEALGSEYPDITVYKALLIYIMYRCRNSNFLPSPNNVRTASV